MARGDRQRQVAGGPGVRPAQRHQQVDVRRPPADAHDFGQRRRAQHCRPARRAQPGPAAGEDRGGQLAAITRLLAAEAGCFERGVVQFQETLRGQR